MPFNLVYLRLAAYVVSFLLGLIPAAFAGYVQFDTETLVLTVKLQGIITAAATGYGGSLGLLNFFGKK